MELDQRLDVLGPVPAPTAVGGDTEVVDEALGGDDPRLGAGEAVGRMEQPEVEARLRAQRQLRQRLEEGDIDAPALHGHVHPVERAAEAERQRVGDVDERLGVVRALAMVTLVPVAEVVTELDVGGDRASEPDEPLDDARAGVVEPRRHDAVEHGELEVRVPLDGELVVWDRLEDRRQLVTDARLVERFDAALVLGRDEGGDRRQRGGERHLEAAVSRDLPVALAAGERGERGQRRLGVAEVVEAQRLERLAVADAQLRQGPVLVRSRRAHLELRTGAEYRVLPHDPVRPRAGLAVGDLAQAVAELGRHHLEHLFGAAQRDAADQEHASGRNPVAHVVVHQHTPCFPQCPEGRRASQARCSPPANVASG